MRVDTVSTPPDPWVEEAPPELAATTGSCDGSEPLKSSERSGASHPHTAAMVTAASTGHLPARAANPHEPDTALEDVRIKRLLLL